MHPSRRAAPLDILKYLHILNIMKTKPLTTAEAGPFAERLRVLGHPLRLLILDRLQAGGPRPVHRLAGALAGAGETEGRKTKNGRTEDGGMADGKTGKRENNGRERALPQAALSQHLSQMRRAGLLAARRRGQEVWYAIADPHALTILNCIRSKLMKTGDFS